MKKATWTMLVASSLVLLLLVGLLAGCGAPAASKKEAYPTKPITLIIPYDAGGSTDQSTRMLVNSMAKLSQPINIVNKPGAAAAIGYKELQAAKNDGYTISTSYTTLVTHKLVGNLPFNHRDLEMIIGFSYDAGVLAVHSSKPWKTVDEFIAYAKQNKVKVSTAVPGGIWNIACQAIMKEYGVEFDLVTSGGGTYQPATELAGGHVDALVGNIAEIVPFVKSGDIRVLAVTSPKRVELFPDIPTFKELGHDQATTVGFRAIIAPKGTPKEVITVLHDAFKKALDDPKYTEYIKNNAMNVIYTDPQQTVKFFDDLEKSIEPIVKK